MLFAMEANMYLTRRIDTVEGEYVLSKVDICVKGDYVLWECAIEG